MVRVDMVRFREGPGAARGALCHGKPGRDAAAGCGGPHKRLHKVCRDLVRHHQDTDGSGWGVYDRAGAGVLYPVSWLQNRTRL